MERTIFRTLLFIYLTLVIMNNIKMSTLILTIGSVGKLVFCLLCILCYFLLIKKSTKKILLSNSAYFKISLLLLLGFALVFNLRNYNTQNLIINLAFPVYFLFYFILLRLLFRGYIQQLGEYTIEAMKYDIFEIFRIALLVNFVIWHGLAIASGANMYELDGNYGGFLQDEIQMGFYAATGFLVSFYLRFTNFNRDTSLFNMALMIGYLFILFFTSRNALLIAVIAATYYFLISKIENRWYAFALFLVPIAILNYDFFAVSEINEVTSGRWTIWALSVETIYENGIIIGQGLSNFNDTVLAGSRGLQLYYLDSLSALSIHSSYIEMVGAGGLALLFIFIFLVAKTWKRLNRLDKTIMLSVLSGALFESILIMPFMVISSLFYLLLILSNFKVLSNTSSNFLNRENANISIKPS